MSGVKFSVLQFFSWPGRRVPIETVFARALDRVEIMDQAGYDTVWLAEHHFNTFSVCPSINVMGSHVAARTKNLNIGMGVSLAALYHPLRLAEEVALIDVLSGGRVRWGAGRGFDPKEFAAFDVPVEESRERFHENVEAVLAAWRNERVTFHGKHVSFEDVEVLPKPHQKPHPPVYLAATSPEAIDWSASEGYTIMMDPHCSHQDIKRKRQAYFEGLERYGHDTENRELPTARLLAIGETDQKGEETAREGARWTMGAYVSKDAMAHMASREGKTEVESSDPIERYVNDTIVHGSPERVADKIRELHEDVGIDHFICSPLSHETFTLFTDKVLPRLV